MERSSSIDADEVEESADEESAEEVSIPIQPEEASYDAVSLTTGVSEDGKVVLDISLIEKRTITRPTTTATATARTIETELKDLDGEIFRVVSIAGAPLTVVGTGTGRRTLYGSVILGTLGTIKSRIGLRCNIPHSSDRTKDLFLNVRAVFVGVLASCYGNACIRVVYHPPNITHEDEEDFALKGRGVPRKLVFHEANLCLKNVLGFDANTKQTLKDKAQLIQQDWFSSQESKYD